MQMFMKNSTTKPESNPNASKITNTQEKSHKDGKTMQKTMQGNMTG